ncbi:brain natriuretic peptide-like protein [Labeo rohita]|uniref:Brain natriuretic peptide-like protein n=2 Tax=Labeo rohita TaxID=84645 RepID=A0A498LW05_LABRO|nr:brain natriuretic peptide-like protein [Labeo rohita]
MAHLDSSISFKGVISDSSRYQSEVSECRAHSSHYWRVKLLSIKELEALVREYTDNDIQDRRTAKTSGNMKSFDIPLFGLLLLFSVQLTGALPLQNTALTTEDMDVLKLLVQRLEESIPASSEEQTLTKVEEEEADHKETRVEPQPKADMRDYLSARDLRTVRQDTKRYSGCFGRKLDRIGSMSSLGCNTAGRSGSKKW